MFKPAKRINARNLSNLRRKELLSLQQRAVVEMVERRLLLSTSAVAAQALFPVQNVGESISLPARPEHRDLTTGTISGTVFNDFNANGTRDVREPALASWTVFIDANRDGTLDSGDPTAITSAAGKYSLNDVPAGSWIVRVAVQTGWHATGDSASDGQTVDLLPREAVRGIDFGAIQPPTVTTSNFDYTSNRPVVSFTFNKPVSLGSIGDAVTVYDLATQQTVSPATYSDKPRSDILTASFSTPLPDGQYAAVLSQLRITDAAGQHLNADADGTGGDDFVLNFFSLAGDVNHDGTVDNTDLQTVLANLGHHGTYTSGDLNGDHKVDSRDLKIVTDDLGHTVFPNPTSYTFVDLTPQGFTDFAAGGLGGGQATGEGIGPATGGQYHAGLFSQSGTFADLNPAGFDRSNSYGVFGNLQVGSGVITESFHSYYHALLWSGSASSVVDLNPAGSRFSEAGGIFADQQVGYADSATSVLYHAKLWHGNSASATDLNPDGYNASFANGTSADVQVGMGIEDSGVVALLWRGTAASAVNLNPAGYSQSEARAVWAGQEVGEAYPELDSVFHAMLWYGTAASAADLNPSGFAYSQATGTNGRQQVGLALTTDAGIYHAMRWSGTAASALDLQQFVPSTFQNSIAAAISANGVILGVAFNDDNQRHLVEWIPA